MKSKKSDMLEVLKEFVTRETPSTSKELLDDFALYLKNFIGGRFGVDCELIKSDSAGNDLMCVFNPNAKDQVLLLTHYDTVFEKGTIKKRPFQVRDGRAYGPGVFDMKGGLVQTLFALEYLISNNRMKNRLVLLVTSDEEVGSDFSRDIIIGEAKRSKFAFVMEPSLNGDLKTQRKGVGTIRLITHGKAAHAGLDPDKGVNAIYAMSSIIEQIKAFCKDMNDEILINVGTINGGSRSNVVPDFCEIGIDLRYSEERSAEHVLSFLNSVKPDQKDASTSVTYKLREPMMKTPASAELFEKVKLQAQSIGLNIGEVSVSGGSDGNICSKYCPVVDGLGAVGGGAHSETEYLLVDTLPERSALLSLVFNIQ